MNFIRSLAHVLWMAITVVPWALFVVVVSYFVSSTRLYWLCVGLLAFGVNICNPNFGNLKRNNGKV
jgi:1-acyl-sn-glycerol-3-phosphate acyltransferase